MKLKEYFSMSEIFRYFFRKNDPTRPKSFNLKVMHGINKLAIIMSLASLVFFIIRALIRE